MTELDAAWRLAIAALIGMGVGVEREWSARAPGVAARFAGVRTFLMLGIVGGAAGLLLAVSYAVAGAVIAAGAFALVVSAYVMAGRTRSGDLDATTEVAALAVIALGIIAGIGWIGLAAGTGSLIVLALREKERLHWLVGKLDEQELRAALQFAALALVVLPLLPHGPLWGELAVRPRALWTVVLLFSALNFGGYLARRAVGAERGYAFTGAIGGIVSSTAVTLTFSRHSKVEPALAGPLARGVVAACTVLVVRVLLVAVVLNAAVGTALLPLLIPQAIAGVAVAAMLGREGEHAVSDGSARADNPLRLGAAIKMAIAFQVAMTVLALAHESWGTMGAMASGAVLGLTDMDALTFSMARSDASISPALAASVIAVGMLANTMLKLGIGVLLGAPAFRARVGWALTALATVSAAALVVVRSLSP